MNVEYDEKSLIEILTEFYNATGVKVSFLKDSENPLICIPNKNCQLCANRQKNIDFYNKCKAADRKAFEIAKQSNQFYQYECHFHMLECIQPVFIDGKVLGFFSLGQMVKNRKDFIEKNNLTEEELVLVDEMKETSVEKIKSFSKILSWLVKYCIYSKQIRAKKETLFDKVQEYIENNYTEHITVEEISKVFNYSKSSMFSLFKSKNGTGIIEYINDLRINKAKELLPTRKASEVSYLVGFTDNNYFTRLFKKKTGMTPVQYKNSIK